MKTLLTAAALAVALLAPTAEARVVTKHHDKTHASTTVKAKTAKKSGTKAKHKKKQGKKSKKASA
ncbi:hypothetical protein [Roseateles sp. BYS96W]|uniref:Acid-shock protein n=1 Tax=Pelomonas nitida TaxID=3299027 RepID=A0ABW7G6D4_9BURK